LDRLDVLFEWVLSTELVSVAGRAEMRPTSVRPGGEIRGDQLIDPTFVAA
jgi:hypothetical protein